MWLLMTIISLIMIIYGSQIHAESAMHQIYSAIYVVGGVLTLALAGLLYSGAEARRLLDERFRFEAPDAYETAKKKRTEDIKTNAAVAFVGIVLLVVAFRVLA